MTYTPYTFNNRIIDSSDFQIWSVLGSPSDTNPMCDTAVVYNFS